MVSMTHPQGLTNGNVTFMDDARLLLIDDDPDTIKLLRQILSAYRHVRFATRGEDALALMRQEIPDLILLDAEMPDESGFSICKHIKSQAAWQDIPIIFVTSHNSIEFETRALSLGAADFIGKPLSPPRLIMRVRNHLQTKRQMDALRQLATVDALTGLANQAMFHQYLRQEWLRAQMQGQPLSLLLIDLDEFKGYNQHQGHHLGDACLQAMADIIRGVLRPSDLAARVGGDEFAILLSDARASQVQDIALSIEDRLRHLARPHPTSSLDRLVTASMGGSSYADESELWLEQGTQAIDMKKQTYTQLLDTAKSALGQARQRGGRQYVGLSLQDVGPADHRRS